ncbi:MAG: hypothetical protein D3910_11400 [Candidatus Electrothrix sp. ATG2]|nr:hypothetical protein [Candidatus Electrothrix sp. ATG2]
MLHPMRNGHCGGVIERERSTDNFSGSFLLYTPLSIRHIEQLISTENLGALCLYRACAVILPEGRR